MWLKLWWIPLALVASCTQSLPPAPISVREAVQESLAQGQPLPTPNEVKVLKESVAPRVSGESGDRCAPDSPSWKLSPDLKGTPPSDLSKECCKRIWSLYNQYQMSYFFDVPENPGDPQGRKIKVFAHTHERPRELPTDQDNPVVFFNGGPGASRESSFSSLRRQQQMGKFWGKKVSFIFLDKRGNGCSTAYLSGDDAETLGRLVHWGSRGTVSDAEHVRKAMLGDRKWRIFGQSYGTFIAHRYLQVAGEGMDSAHAHANALNADPLRRLSNRLRSQHRVLEAFLAAYPSAREPLRLLRDCLGPEDCFEVGAQNSEGKPVQSCGRALLVKMNSFLGFSKNWPILHMWIQAMEGPDGLDHVAIRDFARYFFDPSPQPYAATWEVLSHVDCNTGAWNRETCQAALDLAQADCEDPTSWLIHEYQWTLQKPRDEEFEQRYQALLERVAKLPRDHLTIDQLREALLRHPSVPFYL